MTESRKEIADRIRRGIYRPMFAGETKKKPGDIVIVGGRKVAA